MSDRTLTKAKNYLSEGKVLVLWTKDSAAEFAVQGSDSTPYIVDEAGSIWTCTCPARVEVCAHIQACKLIWKSKSSQPKLFNSTSDLDEFFKKINSDLFEESFD